MMSVEQPRYAAKSMSSGTLQRSLNQVRNHHFILDSPSIGEEVTTGEAFTVGISSCGVTLIEGAAVEESIPLKQIEVEIAAFRGDDAPTPDLERIDMRFVLHGVTAKQATHLVDIWRER
jgi:uncharacterized OsmC-like protein